METQEDTAGLEDIGVDADSIYDWRSELVDEALAALQSRQVGEYVHIDVIADVLLDLRSAVT